MIDSLKNCYNKVTVYKKVTENKIEANNKGKIRALVRACKFLKNSRCHTELRNKKAKLTEEIKLQELREAQKYNILSIL